MVLSLSESAKQEIQRKLDEAVRAKKAPGLVFGIASSQEELLWAQSGLRELDNPDGGPVSADSVFWICSQTKMITAIAAFQLIEAGKLSLDTPVADILPDLANPFIIDQATGAHRPAKNQILVRHLLNHSSGLFYGDLLKKQGLCPAVYFGTHEGIQKSETREDAIKEWFKVLRGDLPGIPLLFEPGTSWEYGTSSDVLGFIVEIISGQSLEDWFKEKIFDPVGIGASSFYLTNQLEEKYVKLGVRLQAGDETVPYDDHFPIMDRNPENVKLHFGGVGLFASPRDYLALQRHLLQILDGTAQKPILQRESLQLFFEPSLTSEGSKGMDDFFSFRGPGQQHGLGLGACAFDKAPDRRKKGTGYWGGWAGTTHWIDPQTGIAVFGGSQVVPVPQFAVALLWEELEPIVYNGLE